MIIFPAVGFDFWFPPLVILPFVTMIKLKAIVRVGTCLLLLTGSLSHQAGTDDHESLDSETELKRMLTFVRPLMAILRSDPRVKRSTDLLATDWVSSSRAIPKKERDGGGYGGGNSGGYGYDSCCDEGHDYLGLISIISLGLLFLFLIQLLSTTTVAPARNKRSNNKDLLSLEQLLTEHDVGRKQLEIESYRAFEFE